MSSASDLSVPQRVWHGLVGGAAYRRLAGDSSRVYPAFLLVAGCTSLAASIIVAIAARHGREAVAAAWAQLPAFSIVNGALVLSQHVSAPVRVVADGALLVLDPHSSPGQGPLGQARYGLAITATDLILRPGSLAGGDRVIPLSALGSITITKVQLGALITELARTGVWLGAAVNVVYAVLRDFVRAAVVAWMGMTMVRLSGRAIAWPQAWRVGLAAWTLPLIAEAVGTLFGLPQWSLWLVASIYMVTGGFAVASQEG